MKRYKNNCVLVYGDLHAPYQDKGALDFLAKIKRDFKPDRVIDIGDTLDQYALSRFPKSPGAANVVKELKKAKKVIKQLGKIFPKVDVMASNHCDRLYQRATVNGIPREWIIKYRELIGAPDGWKWHDDLSITLDSTRKQVYFAHVKTGTTLNVAKNFGGSAVIGHHHSKMGVQYYGTPRGSFFAADTGCLISDKGYQFEYNKSNIVRPTKGCLIIIEGVPTTIPLP